MRALILHANEWVVRAEDPSTRIGGCEPEDWPGLSAEKMKECLVALFHVEEDDTEKVVQRLCRNLKRTAKQFGTRRVMISPFAHLSNSRPNPEVARIMSLLVVKTCKDWNLNGDRGWEIAFSHWGWNKSLMLDVKGHPNAFKHWSS